MSASTQEILSYLSLLADPDLALITSDAWTVVEDRSELVWAGWQPDSVVSVPRPPPASYYESRSTRVANTFWKVVDAQTQIRAVGAGYDEPDDGRVTQWTPPPGSDDPDLERLARIDELHHEEMRARIGWLWVCGSLQRGAGRVPVCFPLFERSVRLVKLGTMVMPQWLGSLRPHDLLSDLGDDTYQQVLDNFISTGAAAASVAQVGAEIKGLLAPTGVELADIESPSVHPLSIGVERGTVLIPGTGYFIREASKIKIAPGSRLHRWSKTQLHATALAEVYRSTDAVQLMDEGAPLPVRAALPLNERQRSAVARLNSETVVAASGPPGTGKTHMIVAAASDAVARGMSVLIATKSEFAAESVGELLSAFPTPPHLRFGSEEHRRAVAEELSEGTPAGLAPAVLEDLARKADRAWDELERVGRDVLEALRRKQAFDRGRLLQDPASAALAPNLVERGFDHVALEQLVTQLGSMKEGWWKRRRVNNLRSMVGAPTDLTLDRVLAGIEAAKIEVDIETALDSAKGARLDQTWAQLERLETDAKATQTELDIARRAQPDSFAMASIAALATSLRSRDRDSLASLSREASPAFLRHLPLWVGTLDEIEDTLPAVAGMFDLVIFDEASQIDQISAAPALCRAKRAFVVGDPKQLRHRSSISDAQTKDAQHHASIPPGPFGQLLEVQHNSLFDLAAAACPITWLDEHFRSVPHLIRFSSDYFYDGQLRLMTQHPRNEGLDAIHPVRITAQREDQTNPAETAALVAHIRRIYDAGRLGAQPSIGVVTPFTGQAEALEAAILDEFDYQAIRDLRLRVGTVHGLQGTQRDVILLSLMIDEDDLGDGLPIIEDPHLFNVMTTRARSQMVVFHSFDPAALPRGVLADWFRYESNPPYLAEPPATVGRWATELAEALELGGTRVIPGYPVAGWNIDLAVGEGDAAFGVETSVHPDGPQAHAERHLTLRRAGWHLISVFESSWLLQTEEAATHIAAFAARRARAGTAQDL